MTTPTNHWKLGLFVIVASFCALVFLVWLGKQSFHKETVGYVSYFDESVTGLDVGSPVSFRGRAELLKSSSKSALLLREQMP